MLLNMLSRDYWRKKMSDDSQRFIDRFLAKSRLKRTGDLFAESPPEEVDFSDHPAVELQGLHDIIFSIARGRLYLDEPRFHYLGKTPGVEA